MVTLVDESTSQNKNSRERRTTKSGYSRSFPIHTELHPILSDIIRTKDGRIFHGLLGEKFFDSALQYLKQLRVDKFKFDPGSHVSK